MSDQTRRRILAGVGGGTAAALLGGTGTVLAADDHDDNGDDRGDGRDDGDGLAAVKIAHFSPDAPNVDVYVDGMQILSDVPFRTVSGNFVLRPGQYNVQVTPTGEDPGQAVIDADLQVDGRAYTAIAAGEVGEQNRPFTSLVHPTDLSPLDGGTSRIRAFHLSPDAPAVDVLAGGEPLFTGLDYTQNQTVEVPAGDYPVEIRPAGGEDTVAQFGVSLDGGWVYTVYVIGYLSPQEAPADEPLDHVLSVDGAAGGGDGNGGRDGGGDR